MRVGILGGTGPAGSGLATRLASVGTDVVLGSRSEERAREACAQLLERWPDLSGALDPGDNQAAAAGDLVVVATPWDGAVPTVAPLADALQGKVVVSMANALTRIGKEFNALLLPRGSVAEAVQAALPGSHVAAAMHHLPAKELGEVDHPVDGDVLVCSDHADALAATADLLRSMPDLRPLEAGTLASAGPIESFTAVLLSVNVRYRTRAAIRFTGIDA